MLFPNPPLHALKLTNVPMPTPLKNYRLCVKKIKVPSKLNTFPSPTCSFDCVKLNINMWEQVDASVPAPSLSRSFAQACLECCDLFYRICKLTRCESPALYVRNNTRLIKRSILNTHGQSFTAKTSVSIFNPATQWQNNLKWLETDEDKWFVDTIQSMSQRAANVLWVTPTFSEAC